MARYEVGINMRKRKRKHVDRLVLTLVRQGYNVYVGAGKRVCFTATDDDVIITSKD